MKLVPRLVNSDELLLDPRNPRLATSFAAETDLNHGDPVLCQRILEARFQVPPLRAAQGEMDRLIPDKESEDADDFFSIGDLKESMRRIGFVGIQNIIVRRHEPSGKFIVLEGNRRVASIRAVLREHDEALPGTEKRLSDQAILESLQKIEVMVFDTEGRDEQTVQKEINTMLGLRHYGSHLMWELLPRAKNIYDEYLRLCGGGNVRYASEMAKTVADILAIKTSEVKQFLRAYVCYKQLSRIFPVKPRHFSLILAGADNPSLGAHGFFRIDPDTFELIGDTPEKFDQVCEFEERDKSGYSKILQDPKSFTRLGQILKESALAEEEAVRRMAKNLFDEVVNKKVELEDAYTQLLGFRKRHKWVKALQSLLRKQENDDQLRPDKFVHEGQDLKLRDDLLILVSRFLRVMKP